MSTQLATREPQKDFPAMLERHKTQLAVALPKHINADRMARIALTCFRMNPRLGECTPASVFAAVIQAAQLGLEPGLSGQAHLVPYWNKKLRRYECQMIPGYQGLIDLARRSGKITTIKCHVVHANDHYDYELGTDEHLSHRPSILLDPGPPLFVYCIAKFTSGDQQVDILPWASVLKTRDKYAPKNDKGEVVGPWKDNLEEMARKTCVRNASKYWPKSIELATALAMDNLASSGQSQGITLEGAVQGDYAAPVEDVVEQEQPEPAIPLTGTAAVKQNLRARRAPEPDPQPPQPENTDAETLQSIASLTAEANKPDDLDLALDLMRTLTSEDAKIAAHEHVEAAQARLGV